MKNPKVKELQRKIEKLEESLFYVNMIDHWTKEDFQLYDKYSKEISELKDLLIEEIAKNN